MGGLGKGSGEGDRQGTGREDSILNEDSFPPTFQILLLPLKSTYNLQKSQEGTEKLHY